MSRCTRSFGPELADLLWTRRHDGKGRWFIVAVESYLGLATTSAEILGRVSGLCRAVAICKESNHRSLMSGPLEALRHLARESLDAGRDEYGVVARALQSLADNDYPCSDLIEDSIAKYSDDPFRASQLLEIAARASQDDNEKKSAYNTSGYAYSKKPRTNPRGCCACPTWKRLAPSLVTPVSPKR